LSKNSGKTKDAGEKEKKKMSLSQRIIQPLERLMSGSHNLLAISPIFIIA